MVKYLGTHNSGTSSKLVWWQRPFGYLLNLTCRCQNLSIEDQLKNFVRFFNIQVTYYKNEWVFSHGMSIYTGKMYDAISKMVQYATPECPVYFQLFLDKNFLLGQNKEEFRKMVANLNNELKDTNIEYIISNIYDTLIEIKLESLIEDLDIDNVNDFNDIITIINNIIEKYC